MASGDSPCRSCGACCASFRVDFAVEEWAGAGGAVPESLAEPVGAASCRMRGTDHQPPRCLALAGRIGVLVGCGIHEWRPSPCREFGLRAPMGIGDEACDAARRRHGLDTPVTRTATAQRLASSASTSPAMRSAAHRWRSAKASAYGCFYGIDTPSRQELMASRLTVSQMAEFIGADSLAFISEDGMYRAMGEAARNSKLPQYCDACFTGDYPVSLTDFDVANKKKKCA